ncbi:MAG: hypothetical protein BA873_00820 [Desulfobulbaceae bacterium C00003063]|nr:MAG: hypothetical protein BA873_00820 [Desulfobulbaceae bacterium C00003063]
MFPGVPFPWDILDEGISKNLRQLARLHPTSFFSLPGPAMAVFSSVLGATVDVCAKKVIFCNPSYSGSLMSDQAGPEKHRWQGLCAACFTKNKKKRIRPMIKELRVSKKKSQEIVAL